MSTRAKFNFLLVVFLYGGNFAFAQQFVPNKSGYIKDPKFNAFIKAKGYSLVGAYIIVQQHPLVAYAEVVKEGKWATIDQSGKIVPRPTNVQEEREVRGDPDGEGSGFDPRTFVHPSNIGLKVIEQNGKKGLLNTNSHKTVIPTRYDDLWLSNFNFVMVKVAGKWGTISKQGEVVMPPQYDEVKSLGVNMAGSKTITADAVIMRVNNKWGLLSVNGKEVISPMFDQIESSWVVNSVLITLLEKKWGMLNKNGVELSKPVYTAINGFNKKGSSIVSVGENKNLQYGLIDSLGHELIKPIYQEMRYVDKYLLAVFIKDTVGANVWLADAGGKAITKPVYRSIDNFWKNRARVTVGNVGHYKSGYIDSTGREVIKPVYETIETDRGRNIYRVKVGGKNGIIDARQQYLLKPEYDELEGLAEDIYMVKKNGKYGIIRLDGKIIVPIKYEREFVTYGSYRNYKAGIMQTVLNGRACMIDLYGNEYLE